MPVVQWRLILELVVLEEFDQPLNVSPEGHEADVFQHELSINLLDDRFRISLQLEPTNSHL